MWRCPVASGCPNDAHCTHNSGAAITSAASASAHTRRRNTHAAKSPSGAATKTPWYSSRADRDTQQPATKASRACTSVLREASRVSSSATKAAIALHAWLTNSSEYARKFVPSPTAATVESRSVASGDHARRRRSSHSRKR